MTDPTSTNGRPGQVWNEACGLMKATLALRALGTMTMTATGHPHDDAMRNQIPGIIHHRTALGEDFLLGEVVFLAQIKTGGRFDIRCRHRFLSVPWWGRGRADRPSNTR